MSHGLARTCYFTTEKDGSVVVDVQVAIMPETWLLYVFSFNGEGEMNIDKILARFSCFRLP